MSATSLQFVEAAGLRVAYREAGAGPAVLLIHGWPTSSFLWRNVMGAIARENRVVAIDLPGLGASDKPTDVRYDFAFFDRVLDDFTAALGIDRLAVAVHDLGGPVGLHWAMVRQERITALALLNTLVYPELSDEVVEFARTLLDPARQGELTSDQGLTDIVRQGLADQSRATPEVIDGVLAPFPSPEDRLALAKAGCSLHRRGFADVAKWLPTITIPVRVIYGEADRVLSDVGQTMARLAADVPHADVTALPGCGHFLQEEAPEEVGELLAQFFAKY